MNIINLEGGGGTLAPKAPSLLSPSPLDLPLDSCTNIVTVILEIVLFFIVGSRGGDNVIHANDFRLFPVRPSRPVLGYVTSAGHRLTTSLDSGLGFVTVAGLIEAVGHCHTTGHTLLQVLARGAKTKYYFVKIDIL